MTETASETTPTTTTETAPPAGEAPKVYDEAYVKTLRSESGGYRTRLREVETTNATLTAELAAAREAADKGATASRDAVRYKVALETGLTPALAARLQGDDEAALKADAESLKALLGDPAPLDLNQGNQPPPPAEKPSVTDALRAMVFGS